MTFAECPCAESTTSTSTPARISDSTRSKSWTPTAAPTRKPPARVLAGVGEVGELVDVLDGNQALQFIVFVNQQQFLDFIFR